MRVEIRRSQNLNVRRLAREQWVNYLYDAGPAPRWKRCGTGVVGEEVVA
ncbi:hypothetical protein ACX80E_05205 [Arthrobacter sp. TMN-49]